jgi:hypothetical protein
MTASCSDFSTLIFFEPTNATSKSGVPEFLWKGNFLTSKLTVTVLMTPSEGYI